MSAPVSAVALLRDLVVVKNQEDLVVLLQQLLTQCAKDATYRLQAAQLGSSFFVMIREHLNAPLLTAPPRLLLFKLIAVLAADPVTCKLIDSEYGFIPILNAELRRLGALCGQTYLDPDYAALLSETSRLAAETVTVDVELIPGQVPHEDDENVETILILNPDDTRALLVALTAIRCLVKETKQAEDFMEAAPGALWLLFDAPRWADGLKTTNEIRTTSLGIVSSLLQHSFSAVRLLENEKTMHLLIGELLQHAHPEHCLAQHISAQTWKLENERWQHQRKTLNEFAAAENSETIQFLQSLEVVSRQARDLDASAAKEDSELHAPKLKQYQQQRQQELRERQAAAKAAGGGPVEAEPERPAGPEERPPPEPVFPLLPTLTEESDLKNKSVDNKTMPVTELKSDPDCVLLPPNLQTPAPQTPLLSTSILYLFSLLANNQHVHTILLGKGIFMLLIDLLEAQTMSLLTFQNESHVKTARQLQKACAVVDERIDACQMRRTRLIARLYSLHAQQWRSFRLQRKQARKYKEARELGLPKPDFTESSSDNDTALFLESRERQREESIEADKLKPLLQHIAINPSLNIAVNNGNEPMSFSRSGSGALSRSVSQPVNISAVPISADSLLDDIPFDAPYHVVHAAYCATNTKLRKLLIQRTTVAVAAQAHQQLRAVDVGGKAIEYLLQSVECILLAHPEAYSVLSDNKRPLTFLWSLLQIRDLGPEIYASTFKLLASLVKHVGTLSLLLPPPSSALPQLMHVTKCAIDAFWQQHQLLYPSSATVETLSRMNSSASMVSLVSMSAAHLPRRASVFNSSNNGPNVESMPVSGLSAAAGSSSAASSAQSTPTNLDLKQRYDKIETDKVDPAPVVQPAPVESIAEPPQSSEFQVLSGVVRLYPCAIATAAATVFNLPYSPLYLPHLPTLWLQFQFSLQEAVPLTSFALLQLASGSGAPADSVWRRDDFVTSCLQLLQRCAVHEHECGDDLVMPQLLSIAAAEPPVTIFLQQQLMHMFQRALKRDTKFAYVLWRYGFQRLLTRHLCLFAENSLKIADERLIGLDQSLPAYPSTLHELYYLYPRLQPNARDSDAQNLELLRARLQGQAVPTETGEQTVIIRQFPLVVSTRRADLKNSRKRKITMLFDWSEDYVQWLLKLLNTGVLFLDMCLPSPVLETRSKPESNVAAEVALEGWRQSCLLNVSGTSDRWFNMRNKQHQDLQAQASQQQAHLQKQPSNNLAPSPFPDRARSDDNPAINRQILRQMRCFFDAPQIAAVLLSATMNLFAFCSAPATNVIEPTPFMNANHGALPTSVGLSSFLAAFPVSLVSSDTSNATNTDNWKYFGTPSRLRLAPSDRRVLAPVAHLCALRSLHMFRRMIAFSPLLNYGAREDYQADEMADIMLNSRVGPNNEPKEEPNNEPSISHGLSNSLLVSNSSLKIDTQARASSPTPQIQVKSHMPPLFMPLFARCASVFDRSDDADAEMSKVYESSDIDGVASRGARDAVSRIKSKFFQPWTLPFACWLLMHFDDVAVLEDALYLASLFIHYPSVTAPPQPRSHYDALDIPQHPLQDAPISQVAMMVNAPTEFMPAQSYWPAWYLASDDLQPLTSRESCSALAAHFHHSMSVQRAVSVTQSSDSVLCHLIRHLFGPSLLIVISNACSRVFTLVSHAHSVGSHVTWPSIVFASAASVSEFHVIGKSIDNAFTASPFVFTKASDEWALFHASALLNQSLPFLIATESSALAEFLHRKNVPSNGGSSTELMSPLRRAALDCSHSLSAFLNMWLTKHAFPAEHNAESALSKPFGAPTDLERLLLESAPSFAVQSSRSNMSSARSMITQTSDTVGGRFSVAFEDFMPVLNVAATLEAVAQMSIMPECAYLCVDSDLVTIALRLIHLSSFHLDNGKPCAATQSSPFLSVSLPVNKSERPRYCHLPSSFTAAVYTIIINATSHSTPSPVQAIQSLSDAPLLEQHDVKSSHSDQANPFCKLVATSPLLLASYFSHPLSTVYRAIPFTLASPFPSPSWSFVPSIGQDSIDWWTRRLTASMTDVTVLRASEIGESHDRSVAVSKLILSNPEILELLTVALESMTLPASALCASICSIQFLLWQFQHHPSSDDELHIKLRVCVPALITLYGKLSQHQKPLSDELRNRVWWCLRLLHPQADMVQPDSQQDQSTAKELQKLGEIIKTRRAKVPAGLMSDATFAVVAAQQREFERVAQVELQHQQQQQKLRKKSTSIGISSDDPLTSYFGRSEFSLLENGSVTAASLLSAIGHNIDSQSSITLKRNSTLKPNSQAQSSMHGSTDASDMSAWLDDAYAEVMQSQEQSTGVKK